MSSEAPTPRLAGLNLWSTSPADLAEFLGDALGIALTSRNGSDGQHFSGRAGQLMISVHPRSDAGVELAFTTDDIEDTVAACVAGGGSVLQRPTQMPYGVSARVVGPDDLRLELVATHNDANN
jgi:predicted enzyme related to lactoylglutathione lyase